ncbi:3561_t:CDS:1 [Acaulospora colombiana]|uniref:3561_t:CDS:1 n=1 Tax=Acaulospora colombiana TaxID=27376 RepID=A0ACA9MJZ2_9GLOM|nr:3561_t:CDS:1 [Acaulospora colombiana]
MKKALALESNELDSLVIVSATCLSLFGWEYGLIEGSEKLKCKTCFRHCELSYFRNIEKHREKTQQQSSVETSERPTQKDKDDQVNEDISDDPGEVRERQLDVNITRGNAEIGEKTTHENETSENANDNKDLPEKSSVDGENIRSTDNEEMDEEITPETKDDQTNENIDENSNDHEKISEPRNRIDNDVEMGEQMSQETENDQAKENLGNETDHEKIEGSQKVDSVGEDQRVGELNIEQEMKDDGPNENFDCDDDLSEIGDLIFDVESQHRWYCSWITGDGRSIENKTAEEFAKKKPGWYVTLEGIVRHHISTNSKDSRLIREVCVGVPDC